MQWVDHAEQELASSSIDSSVRSYNFHRSIKDRSFDGKTAKASKLPRQSNSPFVCIHQTFRFHQEYTLLS